MFSKNNLKLAGLLLITLIAYDSLIKPTVGSKLKIGG